MRILWDANWRFYGMLSQGPPGLTVADMGYGLLDRRVRDRDLSQTISRELEGLGLAGEVLPSSDRPRTAS